MKSQYLRLIKTLGAQNARELRAYFTEDKNQQLLRLLRITGREFLIALLSLPLYLTPVHKQEPAMFNSAGMSFTIYQRRRKATLGTIISAIAVWIVYLSFTSFFLFYADIGRAATITWDGGGADNNWSTAANWSTDSVPGTGDDVVFDGSLGASSTKDVVFDSGVSSSTILSVTIDTGYTGTITLEQNMVVTNDFTQDGGTFTAATNTLDIDGIFTQTNGVFHASSATTSVAGHFRQTGGTFVGNGTLLLDGTATTTYLNLDSSNQLMVTNLTINKTDPTAEVRFEDSSDDRVVVTGTLHLVDGQIAHDVESLRLTIEAQGPLLHESSWSGGASTILISGSARGIQLAPDSLMSTVHLQSTSTVLGVTGSATTSFYGITVSAGTIQASSTASIAVTSSVMVDGVNASLIVGNSYIAPTTQASNNGQIRFGTGTTTITDSLYLSPNGGTDTSATLVDASSSAYMYVAQDFTMTTGTFYGPSGSFLVYRDLTVGTSTAFHAALATTTIGRNFSVFDQVVFDPNGGLVEIGDGASTTIYINTPSTSLYLHDFSLNANGELIQFIDLSDRVVVTGTLHLISGRLNGGNGTVEAQNGMNHEATFGGTNGRIEITGPARTLYLAPSSTFPSLILNSTGTVLNATGGNTTSIYNVAISNGTLQMNTSSLYTSIHLYVRGPDSTFLGGTGGVTTRFAMYSLAGGTIETGDGDVEIGSAFIASAGTVDFSSSTNVTMVGTALGSYADLVSSNVTAPSGVWEINGGIHPTIGTMRIVNGTIFDNNSGTIRFAGANDQHFNPSNTGVTLHNFERISTTTSTLRITSQTSTVVTGNATFSGVSTGTLDIVSGRCASGCYITTGTQAIFTVFGTSTITNARVRDFDASAGALIVAGANVEDLGNVDGITGMFDNTPPSVPGDVTVYARTDSAATLTFGATSSDANFSEYRIHYRQGSSGATTTDPAISSSTDANLASSDYNGATSTTITGLSTSTQYVANIVAYDEYGNTTGATTEAMFYTRPPSVTGASASPGGEGEITVTWSRDGLDENTQVLVEAAGGNPSSGYTSGTSVTFNGLNASSGYTFTLTARDGNNQTSESVSVSATTIDAGSAAPPPAPPPVGGGESSGGGGGNGPAVSALLINGGAQTTETSNVDLALNVPSAAQMAISNDPSFANVSFEPYTSMVNWTLLPGLGERVVYARFTSAEGGQLDANASITVVGTGEGENEGSTEVPPETTPEQPGGEEEESPTTQQPSEPTTPGEQPSEPTSPTEEVTGGESGGETQVPGGETSGGTGTEPSGGTTGSNGSANTGGGTTAGNGGQSNIYGGPIFTQVIPPGIVLSPVSSPTEPTVPSEPTANPSEPTTSTQPPVQTTTVAQVAVTTSTPTSTVARIRTTIAAVPRLVSQTIIATQEVIDNETVETAATVVANPVATVATAAFVAPSVASAVLPLLRYVFLQPLLFLGIRRRKQWGEVYNSLTKLPIGLAIVRLVNPETNQIVESRVTDPDGRYVFLPQPGTYVIDVKKSGFVYPSRALAGQHADGKRIDLYDGTPLEIEEGQPITNPIPVDPEDVEVSQGRILSEARKRTIQYVISGIGVVTTSATLVVAPTVLNTGILAFHIGTIVLFSRVHKPKTPRGAGVITDSVSGKALGRVIVSLYNTKFNKLIGRKVTGSNGKFAFLAGPGEYFLKIEKDGYQSQRVPVTVTDKVKKGFVTTNISLAPDVNPPESQSDQLLPDLSADQDTPKPVQTASAPDQDQDQLRSQIDGPSS